SQVRLKQSGPSKRADYVPLTSPEIKRLGQDGILLPLAQLGTAECRQSDHDEYNGRWLARGLNGDVTEVRTGAVGAIKGARHLDPQSSSADSRQPHMETGCPPLVR